MAEQKPKPPPPPAPEGGQEKSLTEQALDIRKALLRAEQCNGTKRIAEADAGLALVAAYRNDRQLIRFPRRRWPADYQYLDAIEAHLRQLQHDGLAAVISHLRQRAAAVDATPETRRQALDLIGRLITKHGLAAKDFGLSDAELKPPP